MLPLHSVSGWSILLYRLSSSNPGERRKGQGRMLIILRESYKAALLDQMAKGCYQSYKDGV